MLQERTEHYQSPPYQVTFDGTKVSFPSVSEIINKSKNDTGVSIKEEECAQFDKNWEEKLHEGFKNKGNYAELEDYLASGKSNGRELHMVVIGLPKNKFVRIHAHPNIEFEMTMAGCLREFR